MRGAVIDSLPLQQSLRKEAAWPIAQSKRKWARKIGVEPGLNLSKYFDITSGLHTNFFYYVQGQTFGS